MGRRHRRRPPESSGSRSPPVPLSDCALRLNGPKLWAFVCGLYVAIRHCVAQLDVDTKQGFVFPFYFILFILTLILKKIFYLRSKNHFILFIIFLEEIILRTKISSMMRRQLKH